MMGPDSVKNAILAVSILPTNLNPHDPTVETLVCYWSIQTSRAELLPN